MTTVAERPPADASGRPHAVRLSSPYLFRDCTGRASATSLGELIGSAAGSLAPDALAARMLFESPSRARATPYQGIEATVADAAWTGAAAEPTAPAKTADEAARRLRAALEASVARALEGASTVAVLTGGVDSSALLALAHRHARRRGGRAFAVTLDFASEGDDRPHLRAMEAHLGVRVLRVPPEAGAEARELLDTGVDAAPFVWPFGLCEVAMMRRARDEGADVVLSGVGGDELFDGDPSSLASLLLAGQPREVLAAARALDGFGAPVSRLGAWVVRPALARLQPRALRALRASRLRASFPAWAGPELAREAEAIRNRAVARVLDPSRSRWDAFRTSSHREHLFWLRHQEQVSAGIARRDPYLDLEVASVIIRTAPHLLLADARRRGLFRRTVADLLPPSVLARQDKASFAPAFARLLAGLGGVPALRALLGADHLARLGLVDARAFARDAAASLAAPDETAAYGHVWAAAATEAFLRARGRS